MNLKKSTQILTLIAAGSILNPAGCSASVSVNAQSNAQNKAPTHNRIDQSDIGQVLDKWHHDASVGDLDNYFDNMTQGSVFMGTDATERWNREEFRAFAAPHFADGHGWTYRPRDRHISTNAYGDVAWVDETLDHDAYGQLRGTAVLRRNGQEWRIAFYSLTFLVPNELATEVVDLIGSSQE